MVRMDELYKQLLSLISNTILALIKSSLSKLDPTSQDSLQSNAGDHTLRKGERWGPVTELAILQVPIVRLFFICFLGYFIFIARI